MDPLEQCPYSQRKVEQVLLDLPPKVSTERE